MMIYSLAIKIIILFWSHAKAWQEKSGCKNSTKKLYFNRKAHAAFFWGNKYSWWLIKKIANSGLEKFRHRTLNVKLYWPV